MLKKLRVLGAILFVTAGLAMAAGEMATPAAVIQQPVGCCRSERDCAGGQSCGAIPEGKSCPAQNPPYTGMCGAPSSGGTVIPIGGAN